MKKKIMLVLALSLLLVACGGGGSNGISVISREDGSGTRGAFTELVGLVEDSKDMTVESAEITNSTSVMITTVADNISAIGYISLGSLNDSVKALSVDGAEPTTDNIVAGTYPIQRPFLVALKDQAAMDRPEIKDFLGFIFSDEGKEIILDEGYVPTDMNGEYTGNVSGKIVVGGSSSVSPLMERLIEEYAKINPNLEIQLQQSDSTTGVQGASEGVLDMGIVSRNLKDSETDLGLVSEAIAIDGIAVVVNNDNALNDISIENLKKIYTGEITSWDDLLNE